MQLGPDDMTAVITDDSVLTQATGGIHSVFLGGSGDVYDGEVTVSSLVIAASDDVIVTSGGDGDGIFLRGSGNGVSLGDRNNWIFDQAGGNAIVFQPDA